MRASISARWWTIVLGAAAWIGAVPGFAQTGCPWMNVATASGMLNGPATVQIHQLSDHETICTFRVAQEHKSRSLSITVTSQQPIGDLPALEKSSCTAPPEPLQAIGNEAVLCRDDDKRFRGEQVVGRVRDSLFSVAITTDAKDDPILAKDVLDQKIMLSAEQVVGNLF